MLAVGGWNFDLSLMTAMLSSASRRAEFVSNSITYLRLYGFDGLDLDFEYPGLRGSTTADVDNFPLLCQV